MRPFGILLFFLFFSPRQISSQTDSLNNFFKFPLKTIFTYCQDKPDTPYTRVELVYNNDHRLKKYSYYHDTTETSRTVYNYNESGLLTSKDLYSYSLKDTKLEPYRTRLYKYDQQNKLFYEGFDDNNGNNKKYEYVYGKKNELIARHGECNYNKWNELYEYDVNGRLIKEYRDNELAVSYEYVQDLLIKETHYYQSHNTVLLYEYNDAGLLISKKENGKLIETRAYVDGRLAERQTYEIGGDPCFYPCCGQYLYRYDYYAADAKK